MSEYGLLFWVWRVGGRRWPTKWIAFVACEPSKAWDGSRIHCDDRANQKARAGMRRGAGWFWGEVAVFENGGGWI